MGIQCVVYSRVLFCTEGVKHDALTRYTTFKNFCHKMCHFVPDVVFSHHKLVDKIFVWITCVLSVLHNMVTGCVLYTEHNVLLVHDCHVVVFFISLGHAVCSSCFPSVEVIQCAGSLHQLSLCVFNVLFIS